MAGHAWQPACASCYYRFQPGGSNEFCPRCGQQNHDINLSFGHVLEEELSVTFHFGSRAALPLREPSDSYGA